MPLLQKVIKLGHSKVIVLPFAWLKDIEAKNGGEVTEVEVDVDGELRVRPIVKKKGGEGRKEEEPLRESILFN